MYRASTAALITFSVAGDGDNFDPWPAAKRSATRALAKPSRHDVGADAISADVLSQAEPISHRRASTLGVPNLASSGPSTRIEHAWSDQSYGATVWFTVVGSTRVDRYVR